MAQWFDGWFNKYLEPSVPQWVKPTHITITGFAIGLSAGVMHHFLAYEGWGWRVAAGLTLGAGKFFDAADGALARKRKQSTPLGSFVDQLTDKLLIAALLIWVCDNIPWWWRGAVILLDACLFCARPIEAWLGVPLDSNGSGGAKVHAQAWGVGFAMTWWAPGVFFGTWGLLSVAVLLAALSLRTHVRKILVGWGRRRVARVAGVATSE